jgi:hypothetical protein
MLNSCLRDIRLISKNVIYHTFGKMYYNIINQCRFSREAFDRINRSTGVVCMFSALVMKCS